LRGKLLALEAIGDDPAARADAPPLANEA